MEKISKKIKATVLSYSLTHFLKSKSFYCYEVVINIINNYIDYYLN